MKLYGFPPSPNTWKVRAVAAHLRVPLEFEFVDLTQGASHRPEYLALNPTGRTPALVDGDLTLWESTAIMQYIAGLTPNSLWPAEARARADIMRWQSWGLVHWSKEGCEPLVFERLVKQVFNLGAPDEGAVAAGLAAFNKEASVLDAQLAKQPYVTGPAITLADFSIAAPLFHAEPAGLPIAAHAHVQAWFGRVAALPCWGETAPQMPSAAA